MRGSQVTERGETMKFVCHITTLVVAFLGFSSVGTAGQHPPRWTLASDFQLAPHQSNPNPDQYGNQGVWSFMHGATLHDPSSYMLLDNFVSNAFGVNGLEQWTGTFVSGGALDVLPAVGINATGADQTPSTISWPANVIRVHPISGDAVIVGWHSPINGRVRIKAHFSDLDPNGPWDGIRWFIDAGSTTLASGVLPNAGIPQTASLTVRVRRHTVIYVLVDDGGAGNYYNDSTELSLIIKRGLRTK
jgi:hypothetical protein